MELYMQKFKQPPSPPKKITEMDKIINIDIK